MLDVPIRWNLTFLMLRSVLKFKKAFDRLKDKVDIMLIGSKLTDGMRMRRKKIKVGPLMEDDWDNTRRFVKFLSIFYDVNLKFSSF